MSNLLLIKLIKKFRSRDMTAFAVIYKEFEGLILYYSAKLGSDVEALNKVIEGKKALEELGKTHISIDEGQ